MFLVDYENQSQTFCEGVQFSNTNGIEVLLFVQKSSDIKVELSSVIKIHRAETDCPEAADTSLMLYAFERALDRNYNYNNERIFIVKGSEKGYGELLARLQKTMGNRVQIVDARVANLTTCIPENVCCRKCQIVFGNQWDRDRHCTQSQCRYCDTLFACQGEKDKAEKEEHAGSWYYKVCRDVGCTYAKCKPKLDQKHLSLHLQCPKDKCDCEKHFVDESALKAHLYEIQASPEKCSYCSARFAVKPQLYNHIRGVHQDQCKDTCQYCKLICIDTVGLRNHEKRCKKKKAMK